MNFDLALRDFRGFHNQGFVRVRPITILVGENSAGKSSFLAGMKFILDFISGRREPSFNGDPFQLGTYDQIAHFRGGRGGRAREFRISLRQNVALRKSRYSDTTGTFQTELNLFFEAVESHATVKKIRIASNKEELEISLIDDRSNIVYINKKGERRVINDPSSEVPIPRSELLRYWPFLLRELRYRMRHEAEEKDKPIEAHGKSFTHLNELADAITRRSPSVVEATSAIRTRPQRTYTPGTERQDGEGSHVPYELAKLFRAKEKSEWRTVKSSIESFGKQSDMFKELSVKAFGPTSSDPFQLQFSSDGPRTNLVDLGYGTSQVLPILYSIATGAQGSYYLIQQPEVHLHPKAQAALGQYFVDSKINSGINFVLETHSDFIVDRVRKAISDGLIKNDDVSLLFFERERLENKITQIELDKAGDPVNTPPSYRSFFIDEQMSMLGI